MDTCNMTPEMLEKAKAATSAEDLMALAKAHGIQLEAQEAKKLFAVLHQRTEGELTESDLDQVAGGSWERPTIPGSNQPGGC